MLSAAEPSLEIQFSQVFLPSPMYDVHSENKTQTTSFGKQARLPPELFHWLWHKDFTLQNVHSV